MPTSRCIQAPGGDVEGEGPFLPDDVVRVVEQGDHALDRLEHPALLADRLADGVRNATVLHRDFTERGYTGGYNTLARYLRPLRSVDAAALAMLPHPPPLGRRTCMVQAESYATVA